MNNSTLVENYFDRTPRNDTLKNSAVEVGFTALDTLAHLISNQANPLQPEECQAVGQLIREVSMMTFLAYEKTRNH